MGLSATAGEPLGSIGFKSVINEYKWQNKCGALKKVYRQTTSIHQKKKTAIHLVFRAAFSCRNTPWTWQDTGPISESLVDTHSQSYVIRNIKQYFEETAWFPILAAKRRPWQLWSLQRDSAACGKQKVREKSKAVYSKRLSLNIICSFGVFLLPAAC